MKLNLGFLQKWSKTITDRICEINHVDPNDIQKRAILGYNINHPDTPIRKAPKEVELFHGSIEERLIPVLTHGNFNHDFGQGFYLTDNLELAREWSVSYDNNEGYVHGYVLNLDDLKVLDFREYNILHWIAEILSHRNLYTMSRYCKRLVDFLQKYKLDTSNVDVLIGYRADASHFNIIKAFIQNQLDFSLVNKALVTCESGTQYCLKTTNAFSKLKTTGALERIDSIFNSNYTNRDLGIRIMLDKLVHSHSNTLETTYASLMEGV